MGRLRVLALRSTFLFKDDFVLRSRCKFSLHRCLSLEALIGYLLVSVLLVTGQVSAAEPDERAEVVEAAFLLKFPDFIDWPESYRQSDGGKFVISVLGGSTIYNHLDEISADRKILGKALEVRRVRTLAELKEPNILFVKGIGRGELKDLVKQLRGKPVLIVSDMPGGGQLGAMINFFIQGNKVRFEVNKGSIEKSLLKVSFRLLQVAVPVSSENEEGG